MTVFSLRHSSLAIYHVRRQWAPWPHASPVRQRLSELQPERHGGQRGPPEGRPDLEGASHRHLQVRMGEGEPRGSPALLKSAGVLPVGACPRGARVARQGSEPGPIARWKGQRWGDEIMEHGSKGRVSSVPEDDARAGATS